MRGISVVKNRKSLNALGSAIRTSRTTRGIRLADLAAKLNLSIPFLSDVENGRRNLSDDRIRLIAEFFGVDPLEFLKMAAFDRGKVVLEVTPGEGKKFEAALLLGQIWSKVPDSVLDPLLVSLKELT